MKIIIDCRKIFDSGIGTYIYNTIPGVIKKLQELPNIDISILVFKNDYCRLYQLFPFGINFIKVNYKNFSLREQIYINRLIERDSYFWATSLNYPIFIRKNFLISTVYDLIPITIKSRSYLERIIFYLLYWNISKKSQLILFISKFIQNQFIECFNYSGRSKVTYLGVGSDWFVNVTEKEKYIISYCNLKFHKNIRPLLEAFNSIYQKFDYKLMLILNMNVRDLDSDIIKLARTNSSIIVEKNIEKIALINKVSRAKCLVVPSLYEGFGLTILEGMACGCPVLASNVTAIPEVGADTIMYFDPYKDGDLLNKLENLLINDSSELDYIERGRLRAREFTWNRCIDDSYHALTPILKSIL